MILRRPAKDESAGHPILLVIQHLRVSGLSFAAGLSLVTSDLRAQIVARADLEVPIAHTLFRTIQV
jgi:hypothetical protein